MVGCGTILYMWARQCKPKSSYTDCLPTSTNGDSKGDAMEYKTCVCCGIELPASEDFFYVFWNREKTRKTLRKCCKTCESIRTKALRSNTAHIVNHRIDPHRAYKTCSSCHVEMPATPDYFRLRTEAVDGLRGQCKWCEREADKQYYNRIKDDYLSYQKKWRSANSDHCKKLNSENAKRRRALNPEKHKEYARNYMAQNRELYRNANRKWYYANHDKVLALAHDYIQANKNNPEYQERRRYQNKRTKHLRRALKYQSNGQHTAKQIRDLYTRVNGCCAYCGCFVGTAYHVDHVIPLIKGGSNDISNLAIACPRCNLSKGSKLLSEWTHRWYELS
jgi:5-methylcytosine-specific restriction endonuclease McrA